MTSPYQSMMSSQAPATPAMEDEKLRTEKRVTAACRALQDSAKTLTSAQADASDPELTLLLEGLSDVRTTETAGVIRAAADDGFEIEDDLGGTASSTVRRSLAGAESVLAGDQALLRNAIATDRDTHQALQEALEQDLPQATHTAIASAAEAVRAAVVQMESQLA